MNNTLFERLLYEEESTTLDFKKAQYAFVKASEDEKSELLKDILGFANAWRRTEAYILIGVEDVRGSRGSVVGIPAVDHLDDHSVQQFVNSLTNQPIRFHYEAFGFEGKQVGIVTISAQTRPLYLKRDYGKLLKEKVYVRRGSSTSPLTPASLEEIAQMRVGSALPPAELLVEFAHIKKDEAFGKRTSWLAEFCQMPEVCMIPDLRAPRSNYPFSLTDQTNGGFFRELAEFEFIRRLFKPVRLVIKNSGGVVASNVRAELTVPANSSVTVIDASEVPYRPQRETRLSAAGILSGMRPIGRREPGEIAVHKNEERFRVDIDCGSLQPGRRIWSDIFYVGTAFTGDLCFNGLIFADNLPQPQDFALVASITITKTNMTVDELVSLPEPAAISEP